MKIAFENEMIIVNSQNEVQNYIDGEIASKKLIREFGRKYRRIIEKDSVIPELDACQIEIKNSGPKETLGEAQDELLDIFEKLRGFLIQNYGLDFSQNVVPNQEYFPTSSGIYERYDDIMNGLKGLGNDFAKGTNIAGLHINFDTNIGEYLKINNRLAKIHKSGDNKKLGITLDRLYKYQKTVLGVNQIFGMELGNSFFEFENEKDLRKKLFDENGEVVFDYNLLRLKKISEIYVGELRSFDGGVNISDLEDKTKKAYDLILSLK